MAAKRRSSDSNNNWMPNNIIGVAQKPKYGSAPATGRGGQGSKGTVRPGQSTGRGAEGSTNTAKPGQSTGRGARTGEPVAKPKWTGKEKDFPGWKKMPTADTTPKGRGKVQPPKSGGRSKPSGGSTSGATKKVK